MWQWSESGDRWLIRAAIHHQRGRKEATDTDLLFALCAPHVQDHELFVAKAIVGLLRTWCSTTLWHNQESGDEQR